MNGFNFTHKNRDPSVERLWWGPSHKFLKALRDSPHESTSMHLTLIRLTAKRHPNLS